MSLVIASRLEGRLARLGAAPPALPQAEYRFLLQRRLIDDATLAKAESIAQRWGVHLHDVLIANGWIAPEDYYRALADAGNLNLRACIECRRWFTLEAGRGRSDKEYCSNACRMRAYLKRKTRNLKHHS